MLDGTVAASAAVQQAVDDLLNHAGQRYRRLWAYYSNPQRPLSLSPPTAGSQTSNRPYRQAQEWGMPQRVTGFKSGDEIFSGSVKVIQRKEVVVENDIGWRIDTMVDFLFGQEITLESAAPDEERARLIGDLLRGILAANGGLAFLQKYALVGAVYGSADLLVKLMPNARDFACNVAPLGGTADDADEAVNTRKLASLIRLEIVEPARALPILHPDDGEQLCCHLQAYRTPRPEPVDDSDATTWIRQLLKPKAKLPSAEGKLVVEAVGPRGWQVYHDGQLVLEGRHDLGRIPVAHVQNVVRPFAWHGAGDVEPLIPLQDELNTRLSDRAFRVTLNSMKMYLGIGMEGFIDQPVSPGKQWETDNPDARIVEFGTEATSNPAEAASIAETREALDKASGVNPVASGAIRGRVGNLTSAAALRLTFQSLLARTARKRSNYGSALAEVCDLALTWLDRAGLFKTSAEERRIRIAWPDPIPVDEMSKLDQAAAKQRIGVPEATTLRELGYRHSDIDTE